MKKIPLSISEIHELERLKKLVQEKGCTEELIIEWDELILKIVGKPELAYSAIYSSAERCIMCEEDGFEARQ